MEKILKIEEVENVNEKGEPTKDRWECYDGYKIETTVQTILFLINNGQSCCEEWGSMISEDNLEDFIGSNLLSIENVEDAEGDIKKYFIEDFYNDQPSDSILINVNTSNGTLQFALYNDHNGCYGHDYIIRSVQFNDNGNL